MQMKNDHDVPISHLSDLWNHHPSQMDHLLQNVMKLLVIFKNDINGTSSILPPGLTWTRNLNLVGHKESFSVGAAT